MSKKFDCDVVIVGAGVAGAMMAWKLGSQGVKVIVLEAGPGKQDDDARDGYVDNFKIAGTPYPLRPAALKNVDLFTNSTNYYQEQPPQRPKQGPIGSATDTNDPDDPFGEYNIISSDVASKGDWFQTNYERQAGGATWHWLGNSIRFLPKDFTLRSTYDPQPPDGGRAYDWPITYNDLEPWYGAAENSIGVSGINPTANFGTTRSTPYPMPPIPQSYSDTQMESSLDGVTFRDKWTNEDYPLQVSPTPQGRNSVKGYNDRAQCHGSSSCIPICPIQAKYDATQHVQMAQKTGNVEFRVQSVAYQVLADTSDSGKPIAGIRYRRWETDSFGNIRSTEQTVTGKLYVLASHAIENVKILLNSPCGNLTVANESDQVGRNLADHPVSLVYALTDKPIYGYRGPISTSGVESVRDGSFRKYRGAFRMEIGNDGWSWPLGDPYTTPADLVNGGTWGTQLAQQVSDTLTRQLRIGALAEPLPNAKYRVQLSGQRDALGIPLPQLTYGVDVYAQRSLNAAVAASVQIFKKMVARPVVQYNYMEFLDSRGAILADTFRNTDEGTPNIFVREGWAGAGHVMGTHRMGSDPATSVVDGNQRSHTNRNLYLLGSGNWPSYATANPTLTIAALSLRTAEAIKQQLTQ
ncbi:MAG: glucose dehydrogenase [Acidobacteriota bacterium]|jgi:choline dehydrogenase-like flavoprotein|nr:glucose dehydrogenase [Acidobacteriota bacterium]